MNTDLDVKDMKLYSGADSIIAELSALGFGPGSSLNFNEVCKIDQLHYHGTASVQLAIDALAIKENSHVLEIGAGWGGGWKTRAWRGRQAGRRTHPMR